MTEDEMNRFIASLSLATPEPEFNVRNLPSPSPYGTIQPDTGAFVGGGGERDVSGDYRNFGISPGFRAGPVSGSATVNTGSDMPTPGVGYSVNAQRPGDFNAGYRRMHAMETPSRYDQHMVSLARQILGNNVSGSVTEQDGRRGFGAGVSRPLGGGGNAFINAQRSPRGGHAIMGGFEGKFARGGYAGGGDAEVQSNGLPVFYDGQIKWGDSNSASDFARADQALQAMRSAPAPEPQAAPRIEPRRAPPAYSAPRDVPRDVPLPPVRPANLDEPQQAPPTYDMKSPFGALNMTPMKDQEYLPQTSIPMGLSDARRPLRISGPEAPRFGLPEGYSPVGPEAPSAPPPGASEWRRGSFPQEGGGKYANRAMPLTPPPSPEPVSEPLALLPTPTKAVASAAIDRVAPAQAAPTRGIPALSPQQRDLIIRTIAAESIGKTPEEGQGIANVILNRITSGRYGKTPERVLFAPKQFEPWANPRGSNYPMRHKPGTPRYEKAQDALEAAMGGDDITNGATLFWGPKSQAALGRPAPKWGRTGGLDIGETRFHRDNGGMVEEREAHGLEGFVKPFLKSPKHLPLVKPVAKAPRAFELDYPRGAEANAAGRLERSIDNVPLTAPHIAGRQTPGGPDVPLSKQDMEAIMAHITGRPVEYGPLSGGLADAVTVNKGSGRPTGVTIADNLSEAQQNLVVPHAFGHVVDDRAGMIPLTGIRGQAEKAYNTLATGQERERNLTTPRTQGYPREDVPRELSAEMIRAYATDPNYLKTVAPDVAKRIRDYVNTNPELSKIVQFNAVPAAIGAAGAGAAAMPDEGAAEPIEREPHAGGKAVGKAGGELIEKGIKAVSDLFKPAATEMSAEAIAAAEKAAAKAAAQAKQLSRVEQHVDAPSQRINDWQWRPTTDVAKDLDLQEIPPHVQAFGDYMRGMSDKAAKEGLSARDLIKGYTTTRASIQRRSQDADRLRALGLDLPPDIKTIRPEGAWAEWLMTPEGKQYLDQAVKGSVSENSANSAMRIMQPFGKQNEVPAFMDWAATHLPGREQAASDLVARAAQGGSSPQEWRNFTADIRGVGPSKSGFLASLYGRGDQPTLDARQIKMNTGNPSKEASKYIARGYGEGGVEAVDRLAARQSALGLEAPSQYDPFYQHLAHHSIWDKAANEVNTHGDIINAMRNAAIAGGVPAAGAATMPRGEQQSEQQDEQFAHGGIVEREHHGGGSAVGKAGGALVDRALDYIRGWHGSGKQFKSFDPNKMGTGTGEMYGRGAYIAKDEDLARVYREMQLHGKDDPKVGTVPFKDLYDLISKGADKLPAAEAQPFYDRLSVLEGAWGGDKRKIADTLAKREYDPAAMEWFNKEIAPKLWTPGGLYEVGIKAKPEQFMNWDKPLREQSPFIQDTMRPKAIEMADVANQARAEMLNRGKDFMGKPYSPEKMEGFRQIADPEAILGGSLYGQTHREFGSIRPQEWKPEANQQLRDSGVVGNVYRDFAPSGAPTENFVVYNPAQDLDILNRYASGGIVERALHLARGGYATPGFVNEQPEEEYPDGARPLTIYRGERPDAAAGSVEARGDQGPSYDQMGNVVSPGQGADPIVDAAMRVIPPRDKTQSPDELAQRIRDYDRQRAELDAMPEYYRQMTHGPETPRAPSEVEGGFIGKRQFGTAPYNNAEAMSKFYQTLYDMKTLPLYAAGSVFPPANALGMAIDTAEGVAAGSPTQVALSALGAPGKAVKYAIAPLTAATGLLSPDEAQAAKIPKIPKPSALTIRSGTRGLTPAANMTVD